MKTLVRCFERQMHVSACQKLNSSFSPCHGVISFSTRANVTREFFSVIRLKGERQSFHLTHGCPTVIHRGLIQCLRVVKGNGEWHYQARPWASCEAIHNPPRAVRGASQPESLGENYPSRDKSVQGAGSTADNKSGQTPAGEMGRVGLTKKSSQVGLLNLSGLKHYRQLSDRKIIIMRADSKAGCSNTIGVCNASGHL